MAHSRRPSNKPKKNAELTARLEVRERINGALLDQLESEKRALQERTERLQRELQKVEGQLQQAEERNRHYCELTTLLKEELAWFKSQSTGDLLRSHRAVSPRPGHALQRARSARRDCSRHRR